MVNGNDVHAFCPFLTKDKENPVPCNTSCALYKFNSGCAFRSLPEIESRLSEIKQSVSKITGHR